VAKERIVASVPVRFNITGTVYQSNGTTAIPAAYVYLKQANHTKQAKKATNGSFTFTNVLPGSYTIHVYKSGVTFGADVPVTVTNAAVVQDVNATNP
jgi:hypothetical protein